MAQHKLVTIGDSYMQGFINGSLDQNGHSIPGIIAKALGIAEFRHPQINPAFNAVGGIPFNLEYLLRNLSDRSAALGLGRHLHWHNVPVVAFFIWRHLRTIEKLWHQRLSMCCNPPAYYHNLGIISFTTEDITTINSKFCEEAISHPNLAKSHFVKELLEWPVYRVASQILNPAAAAGNQHATVMDHVAALGESGGIENLLISVGNNDVIGPLLSLKMIEPETHGISSHVFDRNANVLLPPSAFKRSWQKLCDRLATIAVERVFISNLPHLTILPIIRGVGRRFGSYYQYYTRPWIWDNQFNPKRDPYLTHGEAQRIDAIIDEYNAIIATSAASHGWHVVDTCEKFDTIAFRRNFGQRPNIWPPQAIAALKRNPKTSYLVDNDDTVSLDTRFIRCSYDERGDFRLTAGGLFSLDGIHPSITFSGYLAHHFLEAMTAQGVRAQNGAAPAIDWNELINSDSLLTDPPRMLYNLRRISKILSMTFFQTVDKVCFNPATDTPYPGVYNEAVRN